jgi:phosphoribosylformimino-5-aminoimidazole carboxamide ribotide isomerase
VLIRQLGSSAMRVIPVIDLLGGLVVRGIGGRRSEYRPIESQIAADALPATVGRAFVEQFGFDTAYVADLDAIMHARPEVSAWQAVAATGLRLWIDAGVGNRQTARVVLNHLTRATIQAEIVVGLESLESEDELRSICSVCNQGPPIFSLDMKEGSPLVRNPAWRDWSPLRIAFLATKVGIEDFILLDLADVGAADGTRTLELCREIRQIAGVRQVVAGGGVRSAEDLRALASAGCDAALVATALHEGRLTRADVVPAGRPPH